MSEHLLRRRILEASASAATAAAALTVVLGVAAWSGEGPPTVEAQLWATDSTAAGSAAAASSEIVVHCRKAGASDPKAVVMTSSGKLQREVGHTRIVGLQKGGRVTMACRTHDGWRAEVEHVVAGGTETVYLDMTAPSTSPPPPKTKTPAKSRPKGIGTVRIDAKPWAYCRVAKIGPKVSPFTAKLRTGNYRVTCTHRGKKKSKRVRIHHKRKTHVKFDFR